MTSTSGSWVRGRASAGLFSALVMFSGYHATGSGTIRASESRTVGVRDESERVCLSLRVLSARVSKALAENAPLPSDCARLAGIAFPEGFIVDEMGDRDVILVGQRSKTRPSLKLDDLIVNMRGIGRAREYPFCSLDPRPGDVRALNALFNKSQGVRSLAEMKAFFAKLSSTVGPQQVVIGGVPRNSRHAHVMIDADYHMKKLSQGHIVLPAVTSYLDRSLDEARKDFQEKGVAPSTGMRMARFWFHLGSGCPTFQEERGVIWLDRCSVVVLTEMQMSTAAGELYDVEQEDPTATSFANNLSEALPGLAGAVPVYADLENLFRLRALLLAMKLRASLSPLGFDFSSYLPAYAYQDETPMAPSYPGLANFREWSNSITRGDTVYKTHLFPMVSGGVGMDMRIADTGFSHSEGVRLSSLRITALLARPSKDALAWEIPTRQIRLQANESAAVRSLREHCKATDVDAIIVSRDPQTEVITVLDANGHAVRVTSKSDAINAAGLMAGPAVDRGRGIQLFIEGFQLGEGEGIVDSWRGGLGDPADPRLARRLPGIVSKSLEGEKLGKVIDALSSARVKLNEFDFAPFEQASRIWQRPDGTLAGTVTIEVPPMGVHVILEGRAPVGERSRFRTWMRKVWECSKRAIRQQFGKKIDPPGIRERILDEIEELKRELPPEEKEFGPKLREEAGNFRVVDRPTVMLIERKT